MLTLALETSTRLGGVALGRDEGLVAEAALSVRATHSETVLDEVARMLDRAGRSPGDLERVVVGAGPGSFTGVRIAAALAKGLCHGLSIPLHAYSSLRAVAASSGLPRVCALFDARRGEVYAEAYDEGPLGAPRLGPSVGPLDRFLDALDPIESWVFAGEGALRHAAALAVRGGGVLPLHLGLPRASSLLWLADRLPEGRVTRPDLWEPLYARASGAERAVVPGV